MLISTYNAGKPLSALEKDFCGQKVCSTMTWNTQVRELGSFPSSVLVLLERVDSGKGQQAQ